MSLVLGNIELLTKIASLGGAFFGFLVALISFVLKVGEWRRRRNALRAPFCEPADVDDDIPL